MTRCVTCKCPLTVLKDPNGQTEPRQKCTRCAEAERAAWKEPKGPKPYRAPRPDKEPDRQMLKIEAFMNGRGKVNNRPGADK